MPRISLDVPPDLLDRLERQAEFTGMSRTDLIVAALTGLVGEFERIDQECGVACPRCQAATEVDTLTDGTFRVCVACTWRRREP